MPTSRVYEDDKVWFTEPEVVDDFLRNVDDLIQYIEPKVVPEFDVDLKKLKSLKDYTETNRKFSSSQSWMFLFVKDRWEHPEGSDDFFDF